MCQGQRTGRSGSSTGQPAGGGASVTWVEGSLVPVRPANPTEPTPDRLWAAVQCQEGKTVSSPYGGRPQDRPPQGSPQLPPGVLPPPQAVPWQQSQYGG